MGVRFGDVRAALHGDRPLPDGWAEDAGTRRYVLDYIDRAKGELGWDGATTLDEFWVSERTTLRVTWRGKALYTLHGAALNAWRWTMLVDECHSRVDDYLASWNEEVAQRVSHALSDHRIDLQLAPSSRRPPAIGRVGGLPSDRRWFIGDFRLSPGIAPWHLVSFEQAVHLLTTRCGIDPQHTFDVVEHLLQAQHQRKALMRGYRIPRRLDINRDDLLNLDNLDVCTARAVRQLIDQQWRPSTDRLTPVGERYAMHLTEEALEEVECAPPGEWALHLSMRTVRRTHQGTGSRDWWYRKVHITADIYGDDRRLYTARGARGIIARSQRLADVVAAIDARFNAATEADNGALFAGGEA